MLNRVFCAVALLMIVGLAAGLINGCTTDISGERLEIQAPASTVPREYAAYSGTVEGLNKRASDEYLRFNAVWCLELGGPELALSDVLL